MKLFISLVFYDYLSRCILKILSINYIELVKMNFEINQKVKLTAPLPYLKTSENMPMLRPPDLVGIDEIGEIISIKSPQTVEVKFRRGSFLIDIDKLSTVS